MRKNQRPEQPTFVELSSGEAKKINKKNKK